MKNVLMMILDDCPYCRQAFSLMEELKAEHPEYADIPIDIQDEQVNTQLAKSLDYWYVPCFFVDGAKIHEGVPTKEKIQRVFEAALG